MILIYVRNIPPNIDKQSIKEVFESFGPVQSVQLIRDKRTKLSFGYCFVTMENREQGLEAIRAMNGQTYWGQLLRIEEGLRRIGSARASKPRHRH